MARQQKPRKMGRPPLPPGEKKLPSMGFRPTPGLRASLEDAARRQGRSVSKEIESRLERSVQSDEAMGGAELYALFRLLGAAANLVEAKMGKEWSADIETYFAVKEAWRPIIEFAGPPMTLQFMNKLESAERRPPPPRDEKDEKASRRERKAHEREVKEVKDRLEEITRLGLAVAAGLLRTEWKK